MEYTYRRFFVHYVNVLYNISCFTVPLVNLLKRDIKSDAGCVTFVRCLCASLSKKQWEVYKRFTSIGSTLESSFVIYLKIDPIGERDIYKKIYKIYMYKRDDLLKLRVNLLDLLDYYILMKLRISVNEKETIISILGPLVCMKWKFSLRHFWYSISDIRRNIEK